MGNNSGATFNCPSCGASIRQDPTRNSMYCSFCGQPIIDVRNIIEQQAALDVRKQEMAAIRGHKAEMQEMDFDYERRKANAQVKNKFVSGFGGCFGTILGKLLGAVVSIIVFILLAPHLLNLIWSIFKAVFKLK